MSELFSHKNPRMRRDRALAFPVSASAALALWIMSRVAMAAAPPVPHVTVVAANAVDGLKALAGRREESFQVLLWRADQYLGEHFKSAKLAAIRKELEEGGARQVEEWGEEESMDRHVIHYLVRSNVIQSRVGRRHDLLIEILDQPKSGLTRVEAILRIEFGIPFKKAAAMRDYAEGTVLDRVFGIIDLERRAKETPRLDRIDVMFGEIGYASSPGLGFGFHLDVAMSDPTSHGRLIDQSVSYMACSGLEPLGWLYQPRGLGQAKVHVARDILVPGSAPGGGEHEHGYPDTFGSLGSGESPREPANKER